MTPKDDSTDALSLRLAALQLLLAALSPDADDTNGVYPHGAGDARAGPRPRWSGLR